MTKRNSQPIIVVHRNRPSREACRRAIGVLIDQHAARLAREAAEREKGEAA